MITGKLRNQIDQLWTEFWTGGITNPLTVIEQISFLMFSRMLDITETRNEKRAARLGKRAKTVHKPVFTSDQQPLRWSNYRHLDGQEMLRVVRDGVFPHFKNVAIDGTTFGEYMKDAQLLIQKPSLLVSAVNKIDALPLDESDTKGDLYEYLLSKLTTAGINGQFRTPRHIIDLMVEMVDPQPTEVVGDPACGTAGFLVGTMKYLLRKHTSPEGILHETNANGKEETVYTGDLLMEHRQHIQKRMFHGFDFDATMLRIASMNLLLHGVETPDIHYQDTLSNSFTERFPDPAADYFDVILANPPFKGSLDYEDVHKQLLAKVKTKKTELLFLVLMLRMLKLGGRCASVVPQGVLFGSSKAHVAVRNLLVEENQLEAVVNLPSGVFKPYAGVATAVLVFTKGGKTDDVFFYDVHGDGFTLDDNRTPDPDNDDLPDVRKRWAEWKEGERQSFHDRTTRAFAVTGSELRENKYDLSVNRYKEVVYEKIEYDPPKQIIAELRQLESKISADLGELEAMLE